MQQLTPRKNSVIIKITKERRRKLFEKDIVTTTGQKLTLITAQEYQAGCAECGLQTVGVAEVVAVGSNVTNMQPGDMVLTDYLVETNRQHELPAGDPDAQYFSVLAITSYHHESYYINGHGGRKAIYKKGEIDQVSPVIAVVRDQEIIANDPYLVLQYEKPESGLEISAGGIFVEKIKEPIIVRTILSSSDPLHIAAGEKLLLAEDDIFERTIDDKVFSIVYKQDAFCKLVDQV